MIEFSDAAAPTEQRNARTLDIDLLPTRAILGLLNQEDELVPAAVRPLLGALAAMVDEAADRIRRGGRVHYFGAGSSGRIAVLDAAELIPTFGLEPGMVIAHLAGGDPAMTQPVEGAEDDHDRGRAEAAGVTADDLVIGMTASGRTPYVAGALAAAAERGAFTALLTCNPGSPLQPLAQAVLAADTGPEAIAGSTRLKATSALKLVLNSFSTALMIRLGKTYSNLMVEVRAVNSKLRNRTLRILSDASGADEAACAAALAQADGDLRVAMVMLLGGAPGPAARQALTAGDGGVRGALRRLGAASRSPAAAPVAAPAAGQLMAADMNGQPGVLRALAARADEISALVTGICPDPAGVLVFGRGAAGHAACYGRAVLRATTGLPVGRLGLDEPPAQRAANPEHGYRGYLAVAVSRSGQTPEVVAALDRLQRAGAHGIAITNDLDSPLAGLAQSVLGLGAGPEQGRPATKTLTAQLLALALLAHALSPRAVSVGALEAVADQVASTLDDVPAAATAAALSVARGVVCLADGPLQAAARAAALTLTQTTSVLTAAYPVGEFGQGPAAALAPGLAVLAFSNGRPPALTALHEEAGRRGAAWIGLSAEPDAAVRLPAGLPDYTLPVLATVRGQQLAWAAARLAARDPDRAGQP
jgi:N-acetylmuramic acid 6-phosphate etherase